MVHELEIYNQDIDHRFTIWYFKDFGYFVEYEETIAPNVDDVKRFHLNHRESIYTLINNTPMPLTISIYLGGESIFCDFYGEEELKKKITREDFDKFMNLFEDINVEQNQKLFRQTLISKTKNKITETLPPELVNEIVKLL